jgi:hypothetical protein
MRSRRFRNLRIYSSFASQREVYLSMSSNNHSIE